MTSLNLYDYFDRIVVINLRKRIDRLRNFNSYVKETNWPFREIEVFEAIHGDKVGVRDGWTTGGGSYGCMLSHTRILERAIMDDIKRIFILEDDAFFPNPEHFRQNIDQFLRTVPKEWDCLMLGGQPVKREEWQQGPKLISPGIMLQDGCERTHAYALQGKVIKSLYQKWLSCNCHIDWVMGPYLGKNFKVYSPDPFLVGQDESKSDISGRINFRQIWSKGDPGSPILLLHAPRDVVEIVRERDCHIGYDRTDEGLDKGLVSIFSSNNSRPAKVQQLQEWIEMISSEALAIGPKCLATIWYPNCEAELIREAANGRLIEMVFDDSSDVFVVRNAENLTC